MPFNVVFFVRPDLTDLPGGDTVQVLATAKSLRQWGHCVTVTSDPSIELGGFDVVHLFHLERPHETYIYLLAALKARKPIALSPIYWPATGRPRPRSSLYGSRGHFWREDAKNMVRYFLARTQLERGAIRLALKSGFSRCRGRLLESASVVLPNSQAEADLIAQECRCSQRFVVVPNVVDLAECREAMGQGPAPRRTELLCVGHFDPRKNQLGLIRATRGLDVSITFIGAARRLHRRYYDRCVRESGGRHVFWGALPHSEILQRMRGARAHICPSHFETPGLVNLEAAVMGCCVVVPDCPPVREYLQGGAIYFDPGDLDSLREAVVLARDRCESDALARHVSETYTLEALAQRTVGAYAMIVR